MDFEKPCLPSGSSRLKERGMERDWRKIFNGGLVSIIIWVFVVGSFVVLAFGEEDKTGWGLSLLGGFNARNEPDIISFAVIPRWGLFLHKY